MQIRLQIGLEDQLRIRAGYNRTMIGFPEDISFSMVATKGSYKGTFSRDKGRATIKATLIDKANGIYKVIMKAPNPYPGPYEYQMPYTVLKLWESNAGSASHYNNKIKGNTAYFPK